MKKFIISMSLLSSFTWLAFLSIGAAIAQNSVSVGVYAEHRDSKIVYHYRVISSGSSNIASVHIGYDSRNDIWELFELPSGWSSKIGIPPTSATSPPVFSITPTPATLWPPNGNLIPVAAAITVKDDYDPQL